MSILEKIADIESEVRAKCGCCDPPEQRTYSLLLPCGASTATAAARRPPRAWGRAFHSATVHRRGGLPVQADRIGRARAADHRRQMAVPNPFSPPSDQMCMCVCVCVCARARVRVCV